MSDREKGEPEEVDHHQQTQSGLDHLFVLVEFGLFAPDTVQRVGRKQHIKGIGQQLVFGEHVRVIGIRRIQLVTHFLDSHLLFRHGLRALPPQAVVPCFFLLVGCHFLPPVSLLVFAGGVLQRELFGLDGFLIERGALLQTAVPVVLQIDLHETVAVFESVLGADVVGEGPQHIAFAVAARIGRLDGAVDVFLEEVNAVVVLNGAGLVAVAALVLNAHAALRDEPVNIAVLRNITVKAVQNLLGAISVTGIQAFAPLLIQGNIYPGITVDT